MVDQLHVAQLIETLNVGGAENLAVQISGQLAQRGFCSHLIVTHGQGPLSTRVHPDVIVHYLDFERPSISNPFALIQFIRSGVSQLSKILNENEIQIVQSHLPGSNFWGLALGIKNNVDVIPTIHNNQEFRYSDRDSALRVFLRKIAYQFVVKKGKATIAVSDAVKESLVRQLWGGGALAEKFEVITNGVQIPKILSEESCQTVRSNYSVPADVPLLVGAGRLNDQKNFKDLVAAADLLNQRGVNFHLLIAGDGPHLTALEHLVLDAGLNKKVQFIGVIDSLSDLFLAADLLVFPSLWEGLPLVLLEAMAAGLPTVANAVDGVTEVLVDGEHGRLVEPGDVKAFADAVVQTLESQAEMLIQGQRARDLVIQKFNFENAMNKIDVLYRDIVTGGS